VSCRVSLSATHTAMQHLIFAPIRPNVSVHWLPRRKGEAPAAPIVRVACRGGGWVVGVKIIIFYSDTKNTDNGGKPIG